jgi:hypothetical protein
MTLDRQARDDIGLRRSPTEAFDRLDNPALQQALLRAASYNGRRSANLPQEIGEGWLMVPHRNGARQVAFRGRRAWAI